MNLKPILLATLGSIILVAASFLVGRAIAPTESEVRAAGKDAYLESYNRSRLSAFERGFEEGRKVGTRQGFRAGRDQGLEDGSAAALSAIDAMTPDKECDASGFCWFPGPGAGGPPCPPGYVGNADGAVVCVPLR